MMKKNIGSLVLLLSLIAFVGCEKAPIEPQVEPMGILKAAKAPKFVRDVDGNKYPVVVIGDQTWMAENLRVTRYNNGDSIGTTPTPITDISFEIEPKYQWAPNGDEGNVDEYGRLYTYSAAVDQQQVCPSGWHLPSDLEWKDLELHIGMTQTEVDLYGWRGTDEAGKLKETGTAHWFETTVDVTDEYGFTAIPAGFRYVQGNYNIPGWYAIFWSSDPAANNTATVRQLFASFLWIDRSNYNRSQGHSIRCIQD